MDGDGLSTFKRFLAERLKGLTPTPRKKGETDYEAAVARVLRDLPAMRETVERNRARVEERYGDLVDKPEGRQATVLENSSPPMLLALAYGLMRESYAMRFDDVQRSLALAELAHRAAKAVAQTDYLSAASASDLIGESLDHLGNALRINSDLLGAERSFADAELHLDRGTRDRSLWANHLGLLAALRLTEGRAAEAAELLEREATLWRLLKDPHKLGFALIGSGLAACWVGDTLHAAKLVRKGAELVEDDRLVFLGLVNLAEAFAREGDGFQAWKLLCAGDRLSRATRPGDGLMRRHRWVRAIACRSQGELAQAERLLTSVRDEYVENGESLRAAFASLDLLAVLAAQGRHAEIVPLAEATLGILAAERLHEKALAAFMILHRAALAERLTEELAVKVANFIRRSRHNREARFE